MQFLSVLVLLGVLSPLYGARLVCYFTNKAIYRPGNGLYTVANIDPFKCTHLIYTYAYLNPITMGISPSDYNADLNTTNPNGNMYVKINALKKQNPALKTMISVGGPVDSNGTKYSILVANQTLMGTFALSALNFLQTYGFDGLDVDWEYPSANDKAGFVTLLSNLRARFGTSYLLSITANMYPTIVMTGYNVTGISAYVDFINVMTWDMHTPSKEPNWADHHAVFGTRMNVSEDVTLNCLFSITTWKYNGAPGSKLNMGIPLYGRSWNLTSSAVVPPAPANGAAKPGPFTGQSGYLGYNEICNNVKSNGWTKAIVPNQLMIGPYAYNLTTKQWVGFDDAKMAFNKTYYALSMGCGGVVVSDITVDDFRNTCGEGTNPVISAIYNSLNSYVPSTLQPITTTKATSTTTTKPAASTTSTKPAASTTSTKPVASTTTKSVTSTTSTKPASTVTTTATTTKPRFVCPADGYYPDPTDCHKYFICIGGTLIPATCIFQYGFNPTLRLCDPNYAC